LSTIFDIISNNPLASGLVVVAITVIVRASWKWSRDHRDSKKIYNFLLKSKSESNYLFRTTEAISSDTKIPEKRVEELCIKHPKIRRNEHAKQSWTLH